MLGIILALYLVGGLISAIDTYLAPELKTEREETPGLLAEICAVIALGWGPAFLVIGSIRFYIWLRRKFNT